jgi:hypothetical protein
LLIIATVGLACSRREPRGTAAEFVLEPAKQFLTSATIEVPHDQVRLAAREIEEAIIAKQNQSFHWQSKGHGCDPHDLRRPNSVSELREPEGLDGCPAGMARLAGKNWCVDRWEAHLVEVLDDGTERAWTPYFNPGTLAVRAKSAPGAVPQGYISQLQASDACNAAGKRLCRDEEWLAACRPVHGRVFPLGTCNDHRDVHPAQQYLGVQDTSAFAQLEHPCINQVPDSLMLTGEKPECVTPEGVFDMVGNLHEWTADPNGTFRGGYYVDTWRNGRGCEYVTTRHEAAYWDYSTGFRCCSDMN